MQQNGYYYGGGYQPQQTAFVQPNYQTPQNYYGQQVASTAGYYQQPQQPVFQQSASTIPQGEYDPENPYYYSADYIAYLSQFFPGRVVDYSSSIANHPYNPKSPYYDAQKTAYAYQRYQTQISSLTQGQVEASNMYTQQPTQQPTSDYYSTTATTPSNSGYQSYSTSTPTAYGPSNFATYSTSTPSPTTATSTYDSRSYPDSNSHSQAYTHYDSHSNSTHNLYSEPSAPSPSRSTKRPLTIDAQSSDSQASIASVVPESPTSINKRRKKSRFEGTPSPSPLSAPIDFGFGVIDLSQSKGATSSSNLERLFSTDKIVGLSQVVEKDYLRLTTAANPLNIRPPAVLRQALSLVKKKWIVYADYEHACSQLKSIRQDCTVQHLADPFVVDVYETHGRISLEANDLQEFAVVQTQLHRLYKDGHNMSVDKQGEFTAYKILHICLLSGPSSSGLVSFMNSLTPLVKETLAVKHATAIRNSLLLVDYNSFFKLYASTPNLGSYFMGPLVESMRERSTRIIASAFRPKLSLSEFSRMLGFQIEEGIGIERLKSYSVDTRYFIQPSIALAEEHLQNALNSAQLKCKQYLEKKFPNIFTFLTAEQKPYSGNSQRLPELFIDCKMASEKLVPSNVNAHGIASSSSFIKNKKEEPKVKATAKYDMTMWIKKDKEESQWDRESSPDIDIDAAAEGILVRLREQEIERVSDPLSDLSCYQVLERKPRAITFSDYEQMNPDFARKNMKITNTSMTFQVQKGKNPQKKTGLFNSTDSTVVTMAKKITQPIHTNFEVKQAFSLPPDVEEILQAPVPSAPSLTGFKASASIEAFKKQLGKSIEVLEKYARSIASASSPLPDATRDQILHRIKMLHKELKKLKTS